jgi:predicted nucleic acid-binding protein
MVFDTDVVIAALRSPNGASAALVEMALDGSITLVASLALTLEYEAVAKRADQCAAIGMTMEEVERDVNTIIALCEEAQPYFRWRPQLADPGDEMVLDAAVNGGALMIVTFNTRDFGTAPERFGKEAVKPAVALERIRKWLMQ